MNKNQCSDYANAGKSGGVNNQGGTVSAKIHQAASTASATKIPPKGVSNGGK
tara:strand:+ start:1635 stop:1790 length:156 start_codon:yes stop_codon:yes gene_type:complete